MTAKKPDDDTPFSTPGSPGLGEAVHFTQTPEFQAAVLAASAEAVKAAEARMLAVVAPLMASAKESKGEGAVEGDMMSNMRQLALAIAEISDQDQGRKRTPPAELAARAHARAQMEASMLAASRKARDHQVITGTRDPGPDAPLYLATGKSYLDETLLNPFSVDPATKVPYPVSFTWMGVPNEAMSPLNDAAKEIFGFFKRSIGDDPPPVDMPGPLGPGWVTAGGLVIQGMNGTPISMQKHRPGILDEAVKTDLYQRGPGEFDPRRDRINILGTVAEPARHIAADGQAPRKGI